MPLTTEPVTLRARLDATAGLGRLLTLQRGRAGGVPGGAIALIAWWMREVTGAPVLLVGANAESLSSDAALWGGTAGLGLFPAADTPPFDRVPPSEEVTRHRLASLALLASGGSPLVVASPAGLLRPALPKSWCAASRCACAGVSAGLATSSSVVPWTSGTAG